MGEATTVTVRGVELEADPARMEDYEAIEAMADMMAAEGAEALQLSVRWMRLVLGADYRRVKDELRRANGGTLTFEDMSGFCTELVEAAGSKN